MAYVWIGTLYSLFYHAQYMFQFFKLQNLFEIFRFFAPLMFLFLGFDQVPMALSTFVFSVNVGGFLFTSAMLFFHLRLVFNNLTTFENGKDIRTYDLGSWFKNLKEVFGKRWYLTWISPLVPSELPSDGVHWDTASRDPDFVMKRQ